MDANADLNQASNNVSESVLCVRERVDPCGIITTYVLIVHI